MNTRTALITMLALLAPCGVAARAAPCDSGTPLTRDEKREARELAVRVVTRLKETGDAGKVSAEFFIEDFAEHFSRFVADDSGHGGMMPIDPRTASEAEAADLRRAYVAFLNLWVQYDLASDYEARLARGARAAQGYGGPALRDVLAPDFFGARGDDPLVAAIKLGFFGRERDAGGADDRAAAARIQSVGRLRSFTAALEARVEQLRLGVGRLRAEAEAREREAGRRANPEDESEAVKNSIYRIESEVCEKGEFGLPAGTQLIRVRAWPYVVLIGRRDGRPRVLGVSPDFDGD